MQYDLEQVRLHLALIYGEPNPVVNFQTYYDPKGVVSPVGSAKNWYATLDDSLEYINFAQSQDCGVYTTVNKTDGNGRKKENIESFRFFFSREN